MRRGWILSALSATLLWTIAASALTSQTPPRAATQQVFGRDERKLVKNTKLYPYRAQCKLYMDFDGDGRIDGEGSGTMVSSQHVLTAGHCVYDPESGQWAKDILIIPGMDGKKAPYGEAWATHLRTFVGWAEDADIDYDLGLITLDRGIGHKTGWLGIAYSPSLRGQKIAISGYHSDKYKGGRQCSASGIVAGEDMAQLFYYLDTTAGSSGAGVYGYVPRLRGYYVLGVNCYEVYGRFNGGPRIDVDILDAILSWMEEDEL